MDKKAKRKLQKKIRKAVYILNYVMMAFFAICFTIFMAKVIRIKILPVRYVVVAILIMAVILGINIWFRKKKIANIIFSVVLLLMGILFIVGFNVVDDIDEFIGKVTNGANVQVTVMEVRVLAEDAAESLEDIEGYTIGYMETRDRDYTDKVLDEIKETIDNNYDSLAMKDDPAMMAEALYTGEVDAIIVNAAIVSIYEDIEAYEDFETKTKVLKEIKIEEEIAGKNDSSSNNEGIYEYNEPSSPTEMSKSSFVVYISGIDSYGDVNVKSRSDVNILMAVNTETKKIVMVNTPRDYYVPLSVSDGVKDKLTHAGNYGVECSRDTLGMLYGVTADYYIRLNFTGFIDIIDAMGGVDVYSDYAFSSRGYTFSQGWNNDLSGEGALAFVRERKSFASGDNQRGKNQMALITSMIKKLASAEVIMNYKTVLDAIAGSFQTNFSSDEIYALVQMQIDDMATWSVESYSVTGTGNMLPTYSVPSMNLYVMEPNTDTVDVAKEKIKNVLSGK